MEQSGGGGGGGWVCQPIKVMRNRGYPKAVAEEKKKSRKRGKKQKIDVTPSDVLVKISNWSKS